MMRSRAGVSAYGYLRDLIPPADFVATLDKAFDMAKAELERKRLMKPEASHPRWRTPASFTGASLMGFPLLLDTSLPPDAIDLVDAQGNVTRIANIGTKGDA